MEKWFGSSGVCINDKGEVLMVLQGKPEEKKAWAVPSGGRELGESDEACCIREVEEETGYKVRIIKELYLKKGYYEKINIYYEVRYYLVEIIGGNQKIQDPDGLIHDIAWMSAEQVKTLNLSFPEDRDFIIDCITKYAPK